MLREEKNMNEKKKPILGQEAVTDARTLGTPSMLILGLQHLFAMFGATVLVPILVQGYGLPLPSRPRCCCRSRHAAVPRVHQVQGPAFLAPPLPTWAASPPWRPCPPMTAWIPSCKLAYALGGIVIAGLLYLVLALLFKLLGARRSCVTSPHRHRPHDHHDRPEPLRLRHQ